MTADFLQRMLPVSGVGGPRSGVRTRGHVHWRGHRPGRAAARDRDSGPASQRDTFMAATEGGGEFLVPVRVGSVRIAVELPGRPPTYTCGSPYLTFNGDHVFTNQVHQTSQAYQERRLQ